MLKRGEGKGKATMRVRRGPFQHDARVRHSVSTPLGGEAKARGARAG